MDEWKRVRTGRAKIVVGTRSAVFAPVQNLGLIVMDEEQESTYKSESTPRYHARDIAKFRVNYNRAYCLLCSATPSVESYYMAQSGKYPLPRAAPPLRRCRCAYGAACRYEQRRSLPRQADDQHGAWRVRVSENIRAGRQSILLLNRRGYHTYAVCKDCKTGRQACPELLDFHDIPRGE